uniref:Uncharacterized protein n=1 Tax=Arundo donax TaxID=35708 RepID=A0A0A9CAR3_ARUDO
MSCIRDCIDFCGFVELKTSSLDSPFEGGFYPSYIAGGVGLHARVPELVTTLHVYESLSLIS